MNIAVNTRLLIKNKLDGIGWFTYETLKRIVIAHPEHQFFFIFDRKYDNEFVFADNVHPVVTGPEARHPFLFIIWFEFSIPRILKKIKADIFLSPDGYLSLKSKIPSVSVIHDLNFEHYPKDLPFLVRKYYRYFFPRFAKKATKVVTVSEYSKNDISRTYSIPSGKIDITCNGVNDTFKPVSPDDQIRIKERYTNGSSYFVFVGVLHPRKNLVNLFRGFDLFKAKTGSEIKLVIVGRKKWWTKEIANAFDNMRFQHDVVFTGRLEQSELVGVIGSAIAMTYISYFEGFGIPVIEAFRCNVPVITSTVTSLPEIAGDAALYADPFNPESISSAMEKIISDNKLRSDLIRKGNIQKEKFTWEKAAGILWNSLEKIIDKNNTKS